MRLALTRYGVERLLDRLSQPPGGDRFVPKGAVLFDVWDVAPHRPARDLDPSISGDPPA